MSSESNMPYMVETYPKYTIISVDNYSVSKKVVWDASSGRWFTVSGEGFRSLQGVANSCFR